MWDFIGNGICGTKMSNWVIENRKKIKQMFCFYVFFKSKRAMQNEQTRESCPLRILYIHNFVIKGLICCKKSTRKTSSSTKFGIKELVQKNIVININPLKKMNVVSEKKPIILSSNKTHHKQIFNKLQ